MLRKMMAGAVALATMTVLMPGTASAWHGGFHRPGFGPGFYGPGFYRGFGPYGGYGFGAYPYRWGYPTFYRYEDLGGCRLARQRVQTRKGWGYRMVEVCE